MIDKVIKETFSPDKKKIKNSKKVVEEIVPDVDDLPNIEEEPGGGVYEPPSKGAVINTTAFEKQRIKGKI